MTESAGLVPTTGRGIRDKACSELGIDAQEFGRRTALAGWGPRDWMRELATDGWRERFAKAEADGIDRKVSRAVRRLLRNGPVALAELPMSELLNRIGQRLRPLAEKLEYDHGGRLNCGPTGVGKTTALVAVFRSIAAGEMTLDPECFSFNDGLGAMDEPFWVRAADLPLARLSHGLGDGEAELVKDAKRASLLVMDDLGWESRRAGADDVISEVIAHRYDEGRVTWVTTGLRPEQVSEKYGDAFVRRICESGGMPGKVIDVWPKEARQ